MNALDLLRWQRETQARSVKHRVSCYKQGQRDGVLAEPLLAMKHYILAADGRIRKAASLQEWEIFMNSGIRTNEMQLYTPIGDLEVFTTFLGIDHNFTDGGPPILWETMIFDSDGRGVQEHRCGGSLEQAREQHERVCAALRDALDGKTRLAE